MFVPIVPHLYPRSEACTLDPPLFAISVFHLNLLSMLSQEHKEAPIPLQASGFGRTSQEYHDVVKRMRSHGGHTVVDIPCVVVIGNQSAGKSSLIQSITEVPVPRSDGTTTRAPFEVRMTRTALSVPWSAQIYIRREYDLYGNKLLVVKEMNEEELSGLASLTSHAFSKNVICIDLAGPDLVDLSFIDLPGIIQNAENDPKGEMVTLVEGLVNTYIKSNCLILVTISMSDDIENQKAGYLAKQADPTGSRTIGVLTKADTIPQGSLGKQQRWCDVLEGRQHATKHGYFCTRLPDDSERERGITPKAARQEEAEFFDSRAPWSTSVRRDRCGTQALIEYLSQLLTQRIRDSLPKIRRDVEAQLQDCKAQLDALPQAIASEPCSFVNSLLMDFCDDIKAHVRGSPISASLVQANRKTYQALKADIRKTTPAFVPFEPEDAFAYVVLWFTQKNIAGFVKPMYLRDIRERIGSHVTRELPNNVPYAAKISLILDFQRTWEQSTLRCFEVVQKSVGQFLTSHIDQQFQRYGNLKAIVNSVVMEQVKLNAEKTSRQLQIIRTYEANFQDTLNVEDLAEKRAEWLGLYKEARANRREYKNAAAPTASQQAAPPPSFSTPPQLHTGTPFSSPGSHPQPGESPFTFTVGSAPPRATGSGPVPPSHHNHVPGPRPMPQSYTKVPGSTSPGSGTPPPSYSQPPQADSAATPTPPLTGAALKKAQDEAIAAFEKLGVKLKPEDLAKFTPVDENQEVLELMAEVRAYFEIASKRIIDLVMFAIDQHFLYEFSAALHRVLYEKLGLHEPNARERCERYLVEEPNVVARRNELLGRKRQLESLLVELDAK
ncbi:P-loop containing nucleoside triphosphate hydrolase protein [Cerioporus squamosus]|nr:P-loop containing nucleoside triphosphate hydrolase protein [Cerioporus squamosus]